jgi:very-short-patch-repair endonuclease
MSAELLITYWPLALFGILVLVLLALARLLAKPAPAPYQKRGELLTETERLFYHVLQSAAGDRWTVFGMVRIADLLKVNPDIKKRQSWQNRINAKHIDFVLCNPESLQVEVCVELDDPSHQRPDRIERDEFVNQAFAAAGLPLLRIPTSRRYDAGKLRELLEDVAP